VNSSRNSTGQSPTLLTKLSLLEAVIEFLLRLQVKLVAVLVVLAVRPVSLTSVPESAEK